MVRRCLTILINEFMIIQNAGGMVKYCECAVIIDCIFFVAVMSSRSLFSARPAATITTEESSTGVLSCW